MKFEYPETPQTGPVETMHGVQVADPYRWLEEIDAPATRAWIEAQNHLTESILSQIPEREVIRRRIGALWNFEKFGVPFVRGERIFFTRNDGLQNQSVLYYMDGPDGAPVKLLDPNQFSADGTIALTGVSVSSDGRRLAYGLSAAGSDWQIWRFYDLAARQDLADTLQWVKFSGASWDAAGEGFYYSRYDPPAEGMAYKGVIYDQKLFYHRLGEAQEADRLVYARPDQKEWAFNGLVTDDGRYLAISVWRGTHRETGLFYQDLGSPGEPVREVLNDFDAAYGFIGNDGPVFYVFTDLHAPRGRVIAVDARRPEREHWREVIPQGSDALQGVSLVGGRLLAVTLHDAYHQAYVYRLDGQLEGELTLPGLGSIAGLAGRMQDRETYYLFTSFNTPGEIYRYDLERRASHPFRKPAVQFNPGDFVTEQVFYRSKDGTSIPMFLAYKRGLPRDGKRPTLLYGYGGFNIPLTPFFSAANLAWMEMGGLYAQANLRGGGEYGSAWHEAGMRLNKQNVFDDFIAAAEWLIGQGYTQPERLAIAGRSNGGLLAAACLTQRPDLFGACLVAVGVLDMLRYRQFTVGWMWESDYGSPEDPTDFRALRAYSPYHNLRPGTHYPATLITTADHDDRVFPAHSFKFSAALQAAQGGEAPVLIRVETRAGHGAGKPTDLVIEEAADMWAFLVDNLDGFRRDGHGDLFVG
ncbi:MAG TPA: prolyl oligopeptidase family serine peptidase [Anaerolineaceae bacterium]|nr:prolyl oligopeptidase family serine peptidase [Anaerolineaceae bacterium]